jgi:hypothetical protein
MLTIRAMVRVGPWTVRDIERMPVAEHCERCETTIKEVWVCEVDSSYERLSELGGKTLWRIGNHCGPTLMEVSERVWKDSTGPAVRRLRYAKRAERLIAAAAKAKYELPDFVEGRFPALLDGTLEERLIRHLGVVMTTHERRLKLRND